MSETFANAYGRLAAAQKGHARGAPAYSVYLNRRMGRVFAALAYRWGWTPNGATAVSAVFTFVGIALIALGPFTWWSGVAIAVLLVLGYAWDSADGQLARLRGGGSLAGEWLDHFIDSLKHATLHLAVLIGLWRVPELRDTAWLLIPLAFSAIGVVTFFGMLLNDLLKAKQGVPSTHARAGGTFSRSLLMLPTDYGVLCLVFVFWGWGPVFLLFYGILMLLNGVFLSLAAVKWFRETRALDRSIAA
ncbi:MAG TPA: CDP-alcohol phosphatidyltransferase [Microbacterium sp.]|nr:CDP-alcohol phosphatidyltransferase [Microbacterium sp.]